VIRPDRMPVWAWVSFALAFWVVFYGGIALGVLLLFGWVRL